MIILLKDSKSNTATPIKKSGAQSPLTFGHFNYPHGLSQQKVCEGTVRCTCGRSTHSRPNGKRELKPGKS